MQIGETNGAPAPATPSPSVRGSTSQKGRPAQRTDVRSHILGGIPGNQANALAYGWMIPVRGGSPKVPGLLACLLAPDAASCIGAKPPPGVALA